MALEIQHYIKAEVTAVRLIPSVHPEMAEQLKLKPEERSVGLISATIDDPLYIGGDDATKKADVRVAFGRSWWATGPTPLLIPSYFSGMALLMLAGPNPAEVIAGLNVVINFCDTLYYSSVKLPEPHGELVWLAYTISRAGTYMAELAKVPLDTPIAYITAPPLEGCYAYERALKAADVKTGTYFAPPTETNVMTALLYGTQSACVAACRAFEDAIYSIAITPIEFAG